MLNAADFTTLWTSTFPGLPMPPTAWNEYVERENMYQDYLDIFRGWNSRANRVIRSFVPAAWYYPHPFFDATGKPLLEQTPCVKYVLVAEAPPTASTFFYNITHLGSTQYYTAPLTAFGIASTLKVPRDKENGLLALAKKGVVLLDIFPFAIKYTTKHRNNLNNGSFTRAFWTGGVYNMNSRLHADILPFKCKNIDEILVCLIAPPIISHYIADSIHHGRFGLPKHFAIRNVKNFFTPPSHAIVIRHRFYEWTIGGFLNGIYPRTLQVVPIYRCCAYSGAGTVPHKLFIQNALL